VAAIKMKCLQNGGLGKIIILFDPLNAVLNPICHLLALLGTHHILHVSGLTFWHPHFTFKF